MTACRGKQISREVIHVFREAVSFEAESNDAIVVRPYRPALVRKRVKGGVKGRQRPNAPPRPHVGLEKSIGYPTSMLRAGDSAPEAVTSIRCHGLDGLLVRVQAEHITAQRFRPEGLLEASL